MEAVNVKELNTRLTGIIWGEAKTGKTTWAMSAPGKKLLINFDPDGYMSVMHRDDFDVLDFAELPPTEAIKNAKKAADHIIANGDQYETVIFDSLTTLVEASLLDAINRNIGASPKFTPTLEAPGLSGYGARNAISNDVIGRILRATSKNNLNCFFIGHSSDPERDDKTGVAINQTIMLGDKIRNTTGLKVSEIYHLELGTGNKRIVHFAPFGIKKPMGSRIIDTKAFPKMNLAYSIEKPDEEQNHALCNIIAKWKEQRSKITSIPA